MTELVVHVTKEELQQMIEASVERTLIELFGDPDEGLELRDEIKQRLIKQRDVAARGEIGRDLEDVVKDLGLE
jgi:hypothetical protein